MARPQDQQVVEIIDEAHAKYWYKISEFCFSKWTFFWLLLGVFFYLLDWIFDIILIVSYGKNGQVIELILTVVVLVGSGYFTSLFYKVNENWIDDRHEYLDLERTNQARKKNWELFRKISQYTMLTPVFRVIFCWSELKDKKRFVKSQIINREDINREEVESVVLLSERNIVSSTFPMIECFFEALPQAILQIYIASVLDRAPLSFDTFTDGIRGFTILSPILTAAFICTRYVNAYYNHLHTLYFMDYFEFRTNLKMVEFTWASCLILFVANAFAIASRLFGISHIIIKGGILTGLIFILTLLVAQWVWLKINPTSRVRYENAPRGETNFWSNMIDRIGNVFTFHNIYPNVYNFTVYHLFYFGTFFTFGFFLPRDPSTPTAMNNFSLLNLLFGRQIQNNETNSTFNSSTSTNDTDTTITYYELFDNQSILFGLMGLSLVTSILYISSLRMKEIIVPNRFPLTKVYKFWTYILGKRSSSNTMFRRYICLCIIATNDELVKLMDHCSASCATKRSRLIQKLDELWKRKVESLDPTTRSMSRRELITKWAGDCNTIIQNKRNCVYIDNFIAFVGDNLENEDSGIPEIDLDNDLRMFMKMCTDFDNFAQIMSSYRLGKVATIMRLISNDESCDPCGVICMLCNWAKCLIYPPPPPPEYEMAHR